MCALGYLWEGSTFTPPRQDVCLHRPLVFLHPTSKDILTARTTVAKLAKCFLLTVNKPCLEVPNTILYNGVVRISSNPNKINRCFKIKAWFYGEKSNNVWLSVRYKMF